MTQIDTEKILDIYLSDSVQKVVQQAAQLVDGGRAGSLSRMEEIAEYSKGMGFAKIGLAYCYGMEADAALIAQFFRNKGIKIIPVSCTVGAMGQCDVNTQSSLKGVSCNPVSQAEQLNNEEVNLTIAMGLCLGHDMLFQHYSKAPVTTLVVKDRVYGHNPIEAIRNNKTQNNERN